MQTSQSQSLFNLWICHSLETDNHYEKTDNSHVNQQPGGSNGSYEWSAFPNLKSSFVPKHSVELAAKSILGTIPKIDPANQVDCIRVWMCWCVSHGFTILLTDRLVSWVNNFAVRHHTRYSLFVASFYKLFVKLAAPQIETMNSNSKLKRKKKAHGSVICV